MHILTTLSILILFCSFSYVFTDIVLDSLAERICPKHLDRNRYLMYNSYQHRCYTFVINDDADWFTARSSCETNGGNLAVIRGWSDNMFIGFRDHVALGHKDNFIWIGLSDTSSTQLQWVNGNSLQYTVWDDNQPNKGVAGDNCAVYDHSSDKWSIQSCSTSLGWLCEYELNATLPTTAATLPTTTVQSTTLPTTAMPSTTPPTTAVPSSTQQATAEPSEITEESGIIIIGK